LAALPGGGPDGAWGIMGMGATRARSGWYAVRGGREVAPRRRDGRRPRTPELENGWRATTGADLRRADPRDGFRRGRPGSADVHAAGAGRWVTTIAFADDAFRPGLAGRRPPPRPTRVDARHAAAARGSVYAPRSVDDWLKPLSLGRSGRMSYTARARSDDRQQWLKQQITSFTPDTDSRRIEEEKRCVGMWNSAADRPRDHHATRRR